MLVCKVSVAADLNAGDVLGSRAAALRWESCCCPC